MQLSALAVRRPVTTLMIFLAIVMLGLVSYKRLPVQLLPDIEFPTIMVFASNDRSPEENMLNITKKLEATISEMPRVKALRSVTVGGTVRLRVEFEYGTDLQYATVDLEERLVSFRRTLSDRRTFLNAYPFSTSDFQASYMFLSVRGRGDVQTLFQTAGEKVEQQLRSISGVANVELRGMTQQSIEVDLNPDLLGAYGLDFGRVMARVQAVSSEDTFLGRLRVPGETHFVRLNDRVRTKDELADIIVDERGIVRLRDVSVIEEGAAVDRWVSRSDGKNAINIRMEREAGRNLIELAKVTRERVEEINASLPEGVELVIAEDLASYVEKAINQVSKLAIQGGLLALLVPFFFFRSFRVALIVFASVPICLISVFNLFDIAGMSINIFSIVGLALGVGMLVDNAIVVTENSIRLYQNGESPRDAAAMGGVEVGRGLVASTLTTVIVFLPFVFLDGEFKVLVKEPALGLAFPLLMSLLVALTLVPVFVHLMLRSMAHRKSRIGTASPRIRKWYARVLKGSLRYRGRVVFFIVLAVTFTWLESCRRVNETATSQEANREWMEFHFQAPRGSKLPDVNRSAVIIEDRLLQHPNIRTFTVSFNSDGGHVSISLKPRAEREKKEAFKEIEDSMLDFVGDVPGANLSLRSFDNPLATPPLNLGNEGTLEIKGLDMEVLNPYGERLIEALRNHPSITNAKVAEERPDPQYLALMDREKSRMFGVDSQNVGRYVGATRSSGTISTLQLIDGDTRTDVAFTISSAAGGTVDEVRRMNVYTTTAGAVPFGELVSFQKAQGRALMRRRDRQASLQISYYYPATTNASALGEDIKKMIEGLPNPGGVTAQLGGEAQRVDERQGQFFFVIIAGMIFVYVVMAAVFESFWVPFTILATNPLMLIGIVWGLDIFGLPLDDLAAFGVIVLIGLAVNNGIVMMDRALDLQRRGWGRTRAVFEASLTRLRPIAMTYLTTVLGLLPMAFIGEEGDQWRPVAVVIIGGLTSATILTLIVLPCFYLIGDDFVRWARRPFYNFILVVVELLEAATNLAMHPIKVLRRRLPFAPSLWPFVRSILALAVEMLRTPLKLIWRAPGDLWFLLKMVFRPSSPAKTVELAATVAPLPQREPTAHPLLSLSNVQVIYRGGVHALAGVNLSMEPGLFGLLGPNGAGKTTLLRCIAGVLEPTRGTVRVLGESHREAGSRLAPLIGYLPQNRGHYEWMTLEQYLDYFATLTAQTLRRAEAFEPAGSPLRHALAGLHPLHSSASRHAAVVEAAEEVNLAHVLKQPIGTFSGGMKQRAGIARVLLQAPPILIVDEPTAGLDPIERVKVRLLLKRLSRARLVLFSTHIVEDIEQSCDRLAIMNRGRILFHGTPDELYTRQSSSSASMEEALLSVLGVPAAP